MGFFSYLRLKVLAMLARFIIRMTKHTIYPNADNTLHIKSREPKRKIKVLEYTNGPPASPQQPAPVLLNFHGSGFILPMHGEDTDFCRLIAEKTGYTVLDVQYRLAPEHPFPAAIEDVEDAVQYVLSNPELYDPKRIAISGFSAGGNLALVACGTHPLGTFNAALTFYPVTDIFMDPGQKVPPDPVFQGLPPAMARLFNECYCQGHDPQDPRISPSYGEFGNYPERLLVITAAGDNLAFEAEELAGKVHQAGKKVVAKRIEGVAHAWDKEVKKSAIQEKATKEAYQMAVDVLNRSSGK